MHHSVRRYEIGDDHFSAVQPPFYVYRPYRVGQARWYAFRHGSDALHANTDLFYDAEADKYIARLREYRICKPRIENVGVGKETQPKIFLRHERSSRDEVENQVVLRDLLSNEERDVRVHERHENLIRSVPLRV